MDLFSIDLELEIGGRHKILGFGVDRCDLHKTKLFFAIGRICPFFTRLSCNYRRTRDSWSTRFWDESVELDGKKQHI